MPKKLVITYSSVTLIHCGKTTNVSDRSKENLIQNKAEGERQYNGYLSKTAKSTIRRCTMNFYQATKDAKRNKKTENYVRDRGLYFLTLTLPSEQIHNDKEVKRKCLNWYLITLQRKHHIKNYIWVSEKQKNGNIHFHLCIDKKVDFVIVDEKGCVVARDKKNIEECYVHLRDIGEVVEYQIFSKKLKKVVNCAKTYQEAKMIEQSNADYKIKRSLTIGSYRIMNELEMDWNKCLNALMYIDRFEQNWGHRFPTTTKIETPKTVNGVAKYLAKYIVKNDKENEKVQKLEGRIWGVSSTMREYEKVVTAPKLFIPHEVMKEIYKHATFEYDTPWFTYWACDIRKVAIIYKSFSKVFFGKIIQNYSEP